MNIIEHRIKSGIVCPCNYLFDEQVYFPNNKLINEEAPFCFRCKKCDFHCLKKVECQEVKLKLILFEDDMHLCQSLEIEYQRIFSNLKANFNRLEEIHPLLGESFITKIFYLMGKANQNNNIITKLINGQATVFKHIIQINQNEYLRESNANYKKNVQKIEKQKQILDSICTFNNELQIMLEKYQYNLLDKQLFIKYIEEINYKAIELQQEFNTSHEFYLIGRQLLGEGNKYLALKYFKFDIKMNPHHLKPYIFIIQQLRASQKYIKALKYLRQMEKYIKYNLLKQQRFQQSTEYLNYLFEKSIVLKRSQKYEEALNCLEEIIKIDPQFPRAQIQKGKVLKLLQRYPQAIQCFDLEIQHDLKNIQAYKNKGLTLSEMGESILALQCFDKILEIDSKSQIAFLNKGLLLIQMKKQIEGFLQFFYLLKLCSDDEERCYKIGNLLAKDKIYPLAIKYYEKSVQLNPTNLNYILQKGNSLYQMRMYQEAIQCYDLGIQLAPCAFEFNIKKGICLNSMQSFQEAIRCFNQAISSNPTYANVHNLKGNALRSQKKYSEAILCYDAALYLQPNNQAFLENKSIAVEKQLKQINAIQNINI